VLCEWGLESGEQTLALLDARGILSSPNNRASRAIGRTFFMSQELSQESTTQQFETQAEGETPEATTAAEDAPTAELAQPSEANEEC